MIFVFTCALLLLSMVFMGRFFVSTEFWLYPYLISKGLVPYIDLVDQHLPGVLFGPTSFATLSIDTIEKAIAAQALLIVLIVVFGYFVFKRFNSDKNSKILLLMFVAIYYLLDGNHLWIEQWSLLALITALFLVDKRGFWGYLVGFMLAFALINRPFALGWTFVIFLLSKEKAKLLIGGTLYLLVTLLWLYANNNLTQLNDLIVFSKTNYLALGSKYPNKAELIKALLILTPVFYLLKRQPILWLAAIISLLGAWPRFELYHLALVLMALFFVKMDKKNQRLTIVTMIVLLSLAIYKAKPYVPDNFYLQKSVTVLVDKVADYGANSIYLFGGPDQVYVLTGTLPAGKYYLPSLSWYHQEESFVEGQINALEREKDELVVVNTNSVVDGKNLIDSSPRIYNYIVTHYKSIGSWNEYRFYKETPIIANKK